MLANAQYRQRSGFDKPVAGLERGGGFVVLAALVDIRNYLILSLGEL